jgi:ABC-type transport system involved in cytochrome c biogenesis permease subunit
MGKKHALLLTIDGIINLVLGILLLLFPLGVAELLGVPKSNLNFYPTILGAAIFGIGIALLIERYGLSRNIRGLGLGGAIAINLCGAVALLIWLISSPLNIPLRGYVIL